ncbi:MAG: D-tyrosyl-tRNA(Tyr) deacylase [Nitrospinae bacterium]|nr:D-tyrosyl-tRNA(Tyr) deacylase [Nitrospinota bacterium]
MIAVVQRVTTASVSVEGKEVAAIGHGLLILLGASKGDSLEQADYLVGKIANLRVFSDREGKMNLSLLEVNGEALVVSQFTLLGDWRKGRRPGFDKAAPPDEARAMVDTFSAKLSELGVSVKNGVFGANMQVALVNDGPVTLVMDTSAQ